jgi:hypothetical protein
VGFVPAEIAGMAGSEAALTLGVGHGRAGHEHMSGMIGPGGGTLDRLPVSEAPRRVGAIKECAASLSKAGWGSFGGCKDAAGRWRAGMG